MCVCVITGCVFYPILWSHSVERKSVIAGCVFYPTLLSHSVERERESVIAGPIL